MGLLVELFGFLLPLVVVAMAYGEFLATRDKMFMSIAAAFAFFAVSALGVILGIDTLFGEVPMAVVDLVGYVILIFGIYTQSKIYKLIR